MWRWCLVLTLLMGQLSVPWAYSKSLYDDLRRQFTTTRRIVLNSHIDWQIHPNEWLNLRQWQEELAVKEYKDKIDHTGDFIDPQELVGKVISCVGTCYLYRGVKKVEAQFLSRIRQGDELHTTADSYAWVFLLDGTLVRISSLSNIAFNEINIAEEKIFIFARLGQGHVFWYPRSQHGYQLQAKKDSDVLSLPLRLVEANREYLVRSIHKQGDSKSLSQWSEEDYIREQYRELNHYIGLNNSYSGEMRKSEFLLALPNISIHASDVAVDALHVLGGESLVRARGVERHRLGPKSPGQAKLYFRGYTNTHEQRLAIGHWMQIDPKGKKVKLAPYKGKGIEYIDELTSYFPTFCLAREILFQRYSRELVTQSSSREVIEKQFGHRFWAMKQQHSLPSLEQRITFLIKHIRKQETANLKIIEHFFDGNKDRDSLDRQFYVQYNSAAMKALEGREGLKVDSKELLSMSQAQFIFWILSHARSSKNVTTDFGQWKSPAQRTYRFMEHSF